MKRLLAMCLLALCCCSFFFAITVAGASSAKLPQLSQEELAYLKEKKTLRVSVLTDWAPFSSRDKNGNCKGLPMMILGKLAQVSGVTLEPVFAQSYEESLRQLLSGEADVSGVMMWYPTEEKPDFEGVELLPISYLTSQVVLVRHKNTLLTGLPIVTIADVSGRGDFSKNPRNPPVFYDTQKNCLDAVRSGQADVAICDFFTSTILMQQYNSRDLVSSPTTTYMDLGLGVLPQTDERLTSALKKTVQSTTRRDMNDVLVSGCLLAERNLFQFIFYYPFEIICVSFALMFVAIMVMYVYTRLRVQHHQALRGYEESYRLLSDTLGEGGMEYDYLNDRLTVFGEKSNLDIPQVVEDFREKLRTNAIRVSLTAEQFDELLMEGAAERSFSAEFQCGVKAGDWVWYRLIYTVICTTESHRRPIRLVGCLANIDAERKEKEQLTKLSRNDYLTGLYNRAAAEKEIRKCLSQEDTARDWVLLVLDVDCFKTFNDELGHFCGDDVLRTLGQSARDIFAKTDILCRWGGDEFLFFVRDTTGGAAAVRTYYEQLCRRMDAYSYQGVFYPVALSAGVARSAPSCTLETLFEKADQALYLAKKNGRARLCIADLPKNESD